MDSFLEWAHSGSKPSEVFPQHDLSRADDFLGYDGMEFEERIENLRDFNPYDDQLVKDTIKIVPIKE